MILEGVGYEKRNSYLKGESVNNLYETRNGRLVASTLSDGVYVSDDGKKWRSSSRGLHVRKVWTVEEDRFVKSLLYAGTQYGHLFRSKDEGDNWEEVTGLFTAPNRRKWGIDWGFGTTGLTIHTVKSDPFKKGRLYVVPSGNGLYRSDDNGENWRLIKRGTADSCPLAPRKEATNTLPSSGGHMSAEDHMKKVHLCVHKLGLSEKVSGLLFQQNHCGIYVSKDFGVKWKDVSPSDGVRHGFGIGVSGSNRVFVVPAYQGRCKEHLSCIKGELKVFFTDNQGESWEESKKGLPRNVHTCVLRDSLAIGKGKSGEVAFGTTTGEVYYSSDNGESWKLLLKDAKRIQGVSFLQAA
ncbi:MAG: hypothetical protein QW767_06900 [Thermoprotei archaeon]